MTQPIIATARTWVGTRFTHQGRRKATAQDAGGVDCLGLLIGVAEECGLRFAGLAASALDKRDYGHYPDEARLYTTLAKHLIEVKDRGPRAGDIALLSIDKRNQHLAIIGSDGPRLTLIHAYAPARKVIEHGLDESWKARITALFALS